MTERDWEMNGNLIDEELDYYYEEMLANLCEEDRGEVND